MKKSRILFFITLLTACFFIIPQSFSSSENYEFSFNSSVISVDDSLFYTLANGKITEINSRKHVRQFGNGFAGYTLVQTTTLMGSSIYAINPDKRELVSISVQSGLEEKICAFEDVDFSSCRIKAAVYAENTLYYICSYDGYNSILYSTNILTGQSIEICPYAKELSIAPDSTIMVLSGFPPLNIPMKISVINPETGRIVKKISLDDANYSIGLNTIDKNNFYITRGTAFQLITISESGAILDAQTVRSVPISIGDQYSYVKIFGENVAVYDGTGDSSVILQLQQSENHRTLSVVSWGVITNGETIFALQNPDVEILKTIPTHFCSEELYTDLITGKNDVDVYCVYFDRNIRTLMERGFLAPISSSKIIIKDNENLYSPIADVCRYNGEIFCVPTEISSRIWTFDSSFAGRLSLPETIATLLQQAQDWENNEENTGSDYIRFGTGTFTCSYAMQEILTQYLLHCSQQNKTPSFDEPELLDTFRLLKQTKDNGIRSGYSGSKASYDAVSPMGHGDVSLLGANSDKIMLGSLPIFPEEDPKVFTSMTVFVINPASPNKDLAINYLECVAQNRTTQYQGLMETNAGNVNTAQAKIDSLQSILNEQKKLLLQTEDEDEKELLAIAIERGEMELDALIANRDSVLIYAPSQEKYAGEIVPQMVFGTGLFDNFANPRHIYHNDVMTELKNYLQMYLEGNISLETACSQMRRICIMVEAEEIK